jgi:hypothetical protein
MRDSDKLGRANVIKLMRRAGRWSLTSIGIFAPLAFSEELPTRTAMISARAKIYPDAFKQEGDFLSCSTSISRHPLI